VRSGALVGHRYTPSHLTAPHDEEGMPANDSTAPLERLPSPPIEVVRAAFRELHGRRLHGFALLLTLGDRAVAARLASSALADGAARVGELRHPERAAAWLRRRVVDGARRGRSERADARVLLELGVDERTGDALSALDRLERAGLIASTIERLDRRDVAAIVGRDGAALDRLLSRARRRFIRLHAASAPEDPPPGPVVTRVRDLARRAMV
jgi:hypothetical protein